MTKKLSLLALLLSTSLVFSPQTGSSMSALADSAISESIPISETVAEKEQPLNENAVDGILDPIEKWASDFNEKYPGIAYWLGVGLSGLIVSTLIFIITLRIKSAKGKRKKGKRKILGNESEGGSEFYLNAKDDPELDKVVKDNKAKDQSIMDIET